MLKSVFFVLAFFLPACGAEALRPVSPSEPSSEPRRERDETPEPAREPEEAPEPTAPEPQPDAPPAVIVSPTHLELRSVRLGRPGCGGAQVWASNMPNLVVENASASPVRITYRLKDPQRRLMWTDCTLQAQRAEVSGVLAAGARWTALGVQWNSGDDSGAAHTEDTSVDVFADDHLVARVTLHGRGRPPVSCAPSLVAWSANDFTSGPCVARAPAMLEALADTGPGYVVADPTLSTAGFSGRQGVSCAAVRHAPDDCGVPIPVGGGAVYTYPAFSGEEACAQ